jgi:hypothetical protein
MREMNFPKSDLLAKIRENREEHIKDYKEAVDGYRIAVLLAIQKGIGELQEREKLIKQGDIILVQAITFNLALPQSHQQDYDRVIAMLEMSIDDKLSVTDDDFSRYVLDQWDWKHTFEQVSGHYKSLMRKP